MNSKLMSEFLGTSFLLMIVVGSGIMGENLSGGNTAMALLANSVATGAGLYGLILSFGSVSGAHFNPVVSLIEYFGGRLSGNELFEFMACQIAGAILGVLLTHAMFGVEILQLSAKDRALGPLYLSEFIATFGLTTVILMTNRNRSSSTPGAVSLYIVAAYWFTSSTSFANPAVTIARTLTNTFSGIEWIGAPGFMISQVTGAFVAFLIFKKSFVTALDPHTNQPPR